MNLKTMLLKSLKESQYPDIKIVVIFKTLMSSTYKTCLPFTRGQLLNVWKVVYVTNYAQASIMRAIP